MKNMYTKAWTCVGVMMLGIVILMSSLAFPGNKVMMNICLDCGSHIGRVYGSRCPHCGEEYSRK